MHPIFQNKYVRFGGVGLAVVIVLFILAAIVLASLNDARSGSFSRNIMMDSYSSDVPNFNTNKGISAEIDMITEESSYYPSEPTTNGYTSDLEQYETTNYRVSARLKQFDELCGTITNLKSDPQIHFKNVNSSTNNCNATFYADEDKVNDVLSALNNFKGVEITSNTSSVTRHKAQLQSQTSILQQQLSSVQRSLTAAETQFDEIADFARQSKDAATLSQAISQKLNLIDNLTNRKINLTSRLNQLYQQAADLNERLDVVEFYVSVQRSNPIYPNRDAQKWENAWNELQETFTDTLIGLTAFFGIFILWTVKATVYLLVILVVLRGLWKVVKLLWQKTEEVDKQESLEQATKENQDNQN